MKCPSRADCRAAADPGSFFDSVADSLSSSSLCRSRVRVRRARSSSCRLAIRARGDQLSGRGASRRPDREAALVVDESAGGPARSSGSRHLTRLDLPIFALRSLGSWQPLRRPALCVAPAPELALACALARPAPARPVPNHRSRPVAIPLVALTSASIIRCLSSRSEVVPGPSMRVASSVLTEARPGPPIDSWSWQPVRVRVDGCTASVPLPGRLDRFLVPLAFP